MTLIIVTHDHDLGARAGRQILMEDGRIVSDIRREPDAADSSALKPVI
jgi:putative ABC transport system ATP-binding protein